jgi:hypothetical protein
MINQTFSRKKDRDTMVDSLSSRLNTCLCVRMEHPEKKKVSPAQNTPQSPPRVLEEGQEQMTSSQVSDCFAGVENVRHKYSVT